jgi:hypothetical protein
MLVVVTVALHEMLREPYMPIRERPAVPTLEVVEAAVEQIMLVILLEEFMAAMVVLVLLSFVGLHHNNHPLPQQETLR